MMNHSNNNRKEKIGAKVRVPRNYIKREYRLRLNDEEPEQGEDNNPYRGYFIRDRDRILFSKAFRRLSRKTQVFLPASDDQVRTRLTHTLEVAQIATITAEALGLDRNLTEAIALGHDIGHAPFGHTGERVLHHISTGCDNLGGLSPRLISEDMGFKHNLQGIRVVSELSKVYPEHNGLNLSNFTLWGIKNHTQEVWEKCDYRYETDSGYGCTNLRNKNNKKCCHSDIDAILANNFYKKYTSLCSHPYGKNGGENGAWSFEAYVVAMCDEIAQRNHDIVDGYISGVLEFDEIEEVLEECFPKKSLTEKQGALLGRLKKWKKDREFTQAILSKIIVSFLNECLIESSENNIRIFLDKRNIRTRTAFKDEYPNITENEVKNIISYPETFIEKEKKLQKTLMSSILNSYHVQRMDGKANMIIRQLAKAFLTNPQQLDDETICRLYNIYRSENNQLSPQSADFYQLRKLTEDKVDKVTNSDKRIWLKDTFNGPQNLKLKKLLVRSICDYISSMTDDFAMTEHARLYSTSEFIKT